jgi:phosphoglycolate phosphatase-like HAD superfamily hydrolase
MSISFDRRDCWIFDMDGTLTISIHDFDGIKRILGLPITYCERGYANDRPILEALNDLPTTQAAQLHQQLDALELDIAHRATAQVGARELLIKLRSRGAQIGILTRNSKPNAHSYYGCHFAHLNDIQQRIQRWHSNRYQCRRFASVVE